MLQALKQKIWQWRGILIAVPSVTAIVLGVRSLGLLQQPEFNALDQFFLLRPPEAPDQRIVIIEINEADVQQVRGWPMSDATLARLLENVRQQKPAVIGLDLYRDLPQEPGHQTLTKLFETTTNLIGVQKVSSSTDSSAVAPPPLLKQKDQVGANDLVLDADGKIRRGMLYLDEPNGNTVFSFSFVLAAKYLEPRGIKPGLTDNEQIQLGSAIFPAFNQNDGGYVRAPMEGYQVLLNYRGDIRTFKTVTMTDVLNGRVPSDIFRDRIVLIGSTAESLKDLFYVPYSASLTAPTRMAGVVIHANLTSQLLSAALDGRSPTLKTWSEPLEWLWILAWTTVGAALSWQQRHQNGRSNRPLNALSVILAGGVLLVSGYLAFLQGWWIPLAPPMIGLVGAAVAITGYVARSAAEMRKTFGRYVTDEVVASLLESPQGLTLGGERRKVTIMLSDLRGFSAISERLPPEKVVTILNLYLGVMSDIITRYNGTINEFIGDGIFVMFGAPIYREDDSQRAIACAVAMQAAMEEVNQQNRQLGLPPIEMGIGINTGEVVVGNIGSQKRAKYTVIGNHVNLAARIESYSVGRQILISQDTFNDAGTEIVQVTGQMQVEPKGIKEPITLYDVNGIGGKYNIYLPEEKEEFVWLDSPLLLRYTVLEGKHRVGTVFAGKLLRLSDNGAELWSDHFLTPLSNLKINLLLATAPELEDLDLYAKVLQRKAETADCVRIRFTGTPPEVTRAIEALLQGQKG